MTRSPNHFPNCQVHLNGFPEISINDIKVPAVAYTSYLPQSHYYQSIAAQGLRLFCIPSYLADRGINIHSGIGALRSGIWKDDNRFDFSDLEVDFDKLLAVTDNPAVILRLHLDVPQWWEEKYPEDCCIQNDGTPIRQSFSSTKWIEDTQRVLKEIMEWLNNSPYAQYLIGIQVAAGGTEEWVYHYFDRFEDNCNDRLIAYRKWLSEHDNGDFSDALPADINPDAEFTAHTAQTFRFHAEQLAERICQYCKTVKEYSEGRLLTGAFYGYHNFIFDPRKGHNALAKLLECPHLDYLASPNAYYREPGKDWPAMAATDSVKLHGKLWMAEHDTRTFCTTPLKEVAPELCPSGQYESGVWLGPKDKRISVMLLRNSIARMLTNHYGGWWFDMWGGWFEDPILLCEIKRCQKLTANGNADAELLPHEVCIITDENLLLNDKTFGNLTQQIISSQHQPLAQAGCSYSQYLRSDLDKVLQKSYKMIWLLGCPDLTNAEKKMLDDLSANQCGILHTDITQSKFRPPAQNTWQNIPAFLDWTPGKLRELYKQCQVHLYTDSNDIVYNGNGFLAIHATSAGTKTIFLPESCTATDVMSTKAYCTNSTGFSISMEQYDTVLMQLSSCSF